MWPKLPAAPDSGSLPADEVRKPASDAGNEEEQETSWEEWPVQAKLAMMLDYLRQTYHYCIFCGCQVSFAHSFGSCCDLLPCSIVGNLYLADASVMCADEFKICILQPRSKIH